MENCKYLWLLIYDDNTMECVAADNIRQLIEKHDVEYVVNIEKLPGTYDLIFNNLN